MNLSLSNLTLQENLPHIGKKVKCHVLTTSFVQSIAEITEIEGKPVIYPLKAIIKNNDDINVTHEIKVKKGEEVYCIVVSYGDNGIILNVL
ncbi:hypothetical protein NUSPORA_02083 [Nucleospora cyclopteri]